MKKNCRLSSMLIGWVCPVCGAVNNPALIKCNCDGIDPVDLELDDEDEEETEEERATMLPEQVWVDPDGRLKVLWEQ